MGGGGIQVGIVRLGQTRKLVFEPDPSKPRDQVETRRSHGRSISRKGAKIESMAKCPHCQAKVTLMDLNVSDEELFKYVQARRGSMRKRKGTIWIKHNPLTSRCRCEDCMKGRGYSEDQIERMKVEERG